MAVPKSILFACTMNSIRSPMAEALTRDLLGPEAKVQSVGVFAGPLDPFVDSILAEIGLSLGEREPKDFSAVDLSEFDLIIVLTTQAEAQAKALLPDGPIEFWQVPNPTDTAGSRDIMMEAYRDARDAMQKRIKQRFSGESAA